MTGDSHAGLAQLFSGTLRGGTAQGISGLAIGSFSNASTSQTAVSLPDYGSGAYFSLNIPTIIAIDRALRGRITIPARVTSYIVPAQQDPFNTDVHATPPSPHPPDST